MEKLIEPLYTNLFHYESFISLLFRFLIDLVVVGLLIKKIYSLEKKEISLTFTLLMFNILIFFVSSLLATVKMKTGFAFGLFAIFSILRYRTMQIETKDMTMLFTCIVVSVINSLVTIKVPLVHILFSNIIILVMAYVYEKKSFNKKPLDIVYDRIDKVHEERYEELLQEIQNKFGSSVKYLEITEVNYLRDTANITLHYK